MWEVAWKNLNLLSCKQNNNSISVEMQIICIKYTESRLQKMGESNELCHFC